MDISSSKNLCRISLEAQIIKELKDSISTLFEGIPLESLAFDVELISLICQHIEDTLFYKGLNGDKKMKTNKLELFYSVYSQVIHLEQNDKQKLERIVRFVVDKCLIERGIIDKIIYIVNRCFRKK